MKFSHRIIAAAILVNAPSAVDAWSCGPGFYGLTRPMVITTPQELRQKQILRQQQILANRMTTSFPTKTSPRYEIVDNEEKFQVALDVPGVKLSDIDVSLEDDGSVLSIAGVRESMGDTYRFSSKFAQSFSLDHTVDVDKITASLQNGVLLVTAPKDIKRIKQNIRRISITEIQDKLKQENAENQPNLASHEKAKGEEKVEETEKEIKEVEEAKEVNMEDVGMDSSDESE